MSTMNTDGKLVPGAGGKKFSCIASGFFTSWAPYIGTPSTKQIKVILRFSSKKMNYQTKTFSQNILLYLIIISKKEIAYILRNI